MRLILILRFHLPRYAVEFVHIRLPLYLLFVFAVHVITSEIGFVDDTDFIHASYLINAIVKDYIFKTFFHYNSAIYLQL